MHNTNLQAFQKQRCGICTGGMRSMCRGCFCAVWLLVRGCGVTAQWQCRPANRALLQQPYTALAQLVNCQPDNIAVVNSATAAWQRVFLGLPLWRPGSRIFTSVAEYGSNYIAYLQVR